MTPARTHTPPSYADTVAWIARNLTDSYMLSTLVATTFGKDPRTVSEDIARYRRQHGPA